MFEREYSSLRNLAPRFGTTSHILGRWLAELGLHIIGIGPSQKAREMGLVKRVPTGRGNGSKYGIWHIVRTVKLLEQAGHRQVV